MEWSTVKILPPVGVDVFVKLADKSISVGVVESTGKILIPANVQGCEDADVLEFYHDPVAWALIPEEFYL